MLNAYDSLNASYGMNGKVLFARVNVDDLKVGHFPLNIHIALVCEESFTVRLLTSNTGPFERSSFSSVKNVSDTPVLQNIS